jgi:hypothetical protein
MRVHRPVESHFYNQFGWSGRRCIHSPVRGLGLNAGKPTEHLQSAVSRVVDETLVFPSADCKHSDALCIDLLDDEREVEFRYHPSSFLAIDGPTFGLQNSKP